MARVEERLQTQRQNLLRQLPRKFGPLPEHIVTQIEETDDLEQLTEWLDRLLEVDRLDQVSFAMVAASSERPDHLV